MKIIAYWLTDWLNDGESCYSQLIIQLGSRAWGNLCCIWCVHLCQCFVMSFHLSRGINFHNSAGKQKLNTADRLSIVWSQWKTLLWTSNLWMTTEIWFSKWDFVLSPLWKGLDDHDTFEIQRRTFQTGKAKLNSLHQSGLSCNNWIKCASNTRRKFFQK